MNADRIRRQIEQLRRSRRSVAPREAERLLKSAGFELMGKRGKGDHRIYRHPSGRKVGLDPRNPLLPAYVKHVIDAVEEVIGDGDNETNS